MNILVTVFRCTISMEMPSRGIWNKIWVIVRDRINRGGCWELQISWVELYWSENYQVAHPTPSTTILRDINSNLQYKYILKLQKLWNISNMTNSTINLNQKKHYTHLTHRPELLSSIELKFNKNKSLITN